VWSTLGAAPVVGGGGGDEDRLRSAVIGLDFTPNAVHAPIYIAVRKGYDRKHGIKLRIRPPGSSPDSLKLLASGRADVAVLDIHDLGLARQRGADVVAVAALVQRPLAAIIAQPDVHRPRQLEGRTVGVSGLPSDPAVLRAVVEGDGGNYDKVRQVTIGFAAVPNLIQKKIDAVPAFWNAEGVILRQRGVPTREFRVADFGAPP
jgi:putative hydroxymethylpyrimidine transport system substrate-binding protein